jgi:cytochrome P450
MHLVISLVGIGTAINEYRIYFFEEHPDFDVEAHRQYVQYLKNRDGLRPLIIEFVRRIREQMQREKETLKSNGTISEWIPNGLLELSHRMIFQPSTIALFGEIEPLSLEKDYQLFDNSFHYFYADIPRRLFAWLFPEELKARARLNASWFKNLHPPQESEFMQARKILFQDNSDWFSDRDLCSCQTGIFWGSLGNTIPAVFWSLLYILQDTKAVETIQQEIDTNLPFFSLDNDPGDSPIEEWTPEQLNSCVYLESAVNEALRMAGAALLTRKCHKETQIVLQDGRTLIVKPNETVAYFAGVTHVDANLFPEPNKFIFDRFLNKTADAVPGFMPFGAGKNMCPGRFFAKNEIKICLAMLLRYMEYKFVDMKIIIPKQKPQRIGFGVAPPNKDVPIMYRYKT